MECHSNEMSLKMECPSKWNVTQNEMSLKIKWNSKWNVTQNYQRLTGNDEDK